MIQLRGKRATPKSSWLRSAPKSNQSMISSNMQSELPLEKRSGEKHVGRAACSPFRCDEPELSASVSYKLQLLSYLGAGFARTHLRVVRGAIGGSEAWKDLREVRVLFRNRFTHAEEPCVGVSVRPFGYQRRGGPVSTFWDPACTRSLFLLCIFRCLGQ